MRAVIRCLLTPIAIATVLLSACGTRHATSLDISDKEQHLLDVLQIDRGMRIVRMYRNDDAELQVITRQGDETIRYSLMPDHDDVLRLRYHAPGVALPTNMVLPPDADPFESRR